MNINDMKEIVKRRNQLINNYDESELMKFSIVQYNNLINDLKLQNYKLLYYLINNNNTINLKYTEEIIKHNYNIEFIKMLDELLNILNVHQITENDITPFNYIEINNEEIKNITKDFYKNLNNELINKININNILNDELLYIKTDSFLYNLVNKNFCGGKTYPDIINDISYIIINKKNSINDIYALTHETMHSINFKINKPIYNNHFYEIIAYTTVYLLNDYLLNNTIYEKLIQNKDKSNTKRIQNTIYNTKQMLENKEFNINKLKNNTYDYIDILLLEKILNTILPYTIYNKTKENKNTITNLLTYDPKYHLIDNYDFININNQEILNNTKTLIKKI